MNKTQFLRFIGDVAEKLRGLSNSKGVEYAGSDNQFANFERLADRLGLDRERVLMVYLSKHMDAIDSWIKTRKEYSEPIEGRIEDAILYLTLLLAMVKSSKQYDIRNSPIVGAESTEGPKGLNGLNTPVTFYGTGSCL
jgi:hypothetical protein